VVTGTGLDEEADCRNTATLAFAYSGSQREESGRETWNGEGRVGSAADGVYRGTTEAEVRDQSVCGHEAISGKTTVSVANGVAVFRYDGETDCDDESTVTWTLDGVDQGEISGVSCAAVAVENASWLALPLLLLAFRRRTRLVRYFDREAVK